jgi:hypothetical protein
MTREIALGIAVALAVYMLTRTPKMVWAQSSSGRVFYVKNLEDAMRAADHLEELERRMVEFVARAHETMPDDERILRIRDRWNGVLSEVEDSKDNVAYSLGKTTIHVCVREKDGTLADNNSAIFVLLHELAHVATISYGHTNLFWKNMRFLLELAEYLGYYKHTDHAEKTAMLCGRMLGPSPLTCVKSSTCKSELSSN